MFNLITGAYSNDPVKINIVSNNNAFFERIGYFKGNKDRVFTVLYQDGATPLTIQAYAKNLPHTLESMTTAYFYKEGSTVPNDGVTLANGSISAINIIFETPGLSSWQYAYMIFRTGQEKFVDCIKTSSSDLCKQ
ncbi:MAG: hypothetical protein COB26_04715 [Piscirickettsiaceae bacterium]|nr:MAG: hypothetical protein COB89_00455 [Piscirickettsiaceae bacterium]PCI70290.1 MAG: hypothetical protein COB26_04715 [Piscirickettsiaceae bacterium]